MDPELPVMNSIYSHFVNQNLSYFHHTTALSLYGYLGQKLLNRMTAITYSVSINLFSITDSLFVPTLDCFFRYSSIWVEVLEKMSALSNLIQFIYINSKIKIRKKWAPNCFFKIELNASMKLKVIQTSNLISKHSNETNVI